MRRSVAIVLLVGLLLAVGLLVALPAWACSCVGGTTAEFFQRADAVFTGRLVSREEPRGPFSGSGAPALYVFAVGTVHKGVVHREQGVLSPVLGATCGLELAGDGPFAVFATLADGRYAASLCGGTAPLTPALEAELQALAPPITAPRAGTAGTDRPGPPIGSVLPGTAVLALVLGAGALPLRGRHPAAERPR